jgi:hypothetical protein
MTSAASTHTQRSISIKPNRGTTNSGYKIAVRFGDQVLQAGFTSVPNLILNRYAELGITPAEMMFTIHIWQFRWTQRDPYPSLTTIAHKMHVSWRQAHRYANSLKKKGFLIITSRQKPGRGQVTSEYDFEPLIRAAINLDRDMVTSGSEAETTPLTKMIGGAMTDLTEAPLTPMSEEEYKEQEDTLQEDVNPSNTRVATSLKVNNQHAVTNKGSKESDLTGRKQGRGGGFSSIADTLAATKRRFAPKTSGEEREALMHYVAKFADELEDQASLRTSTARAYNLLTRANVHLGVFIGRMYEAHAITKESVASARKRSGMARVRKAAPATNKMAYWFSVLEDRLGLRPERATRGGQGGAKGVQELS